MHDDGNLTAATRRPQRRTGRAPDTFGNMIRWTTFMVAVALIVLLLTESGAGFRQFVFRLIAQLARILL